MKEIKNRIKNVTTDYVGKGYQILSAKKKEINVDDKPALWREVIPGFLFRMFVVIFLFLYGLKIVLLENEVTNTVGGWWIFRVIGVVLVFISLYLLYNIFAKKVNKETYVKWTIAFGAVLIFLLLLIWSGDFTFTDVLNLIIIVF